MPLKSTLCAVMAALTLTAAAVAGETISVTDAYARSSGKAAKAGAAFMTIENTGAADDLLIGVSSDAAARVELHTHKVDDQGVARMMPVEVGLTVPAGDAHTLKRGGDHVMFMGLTRPFEQGMTIPVTLEFEGAGEITIEIPVDLER